MKSIIQIWKAKALIVSFCTLYFDLITIKSVNVYQQKLLQHQILWWNTAVSELSTINPSMLICITKCSNIFGIQCTSFIEKIIYTCICVYVYIYAKQTNKQLENRYLIGPSCTGDRRWATGLIFYITPIVLCILNHYMEIKNRMNPLCS
jgi:hypothetical protein